jgi:hypothetical protein
MAATLTILQAGSYDKIRAAVDLSLDSNLLPDATIEQDQFGPAAEQEVLEREALVLPTAINAAEQVLHRELAAIYLTAARLAQALPAITEQMLGDSRYSRTAFDPQRRHRSLRTLAERELATYLEGTKLPHIQQQAWLAKGRRGH